MPAVTGSFARRTLGVSAALVVLLTSGPAAIAAPGPAAPPAAPSASMRTPAGAATTTDKASKDKASKDKAPTKSAAPAKKPSSAASAKAEKARKAAVAKKAAEAKKKVDEHAAELTRQAASEAADRFAAVAAASTTAQARYKIAQAKLDAARSQLSSATTAASRADRQRSVAEVRTGAAGDQVDRYAANLYKNGSVPQLAQIAIAERPDQALATADLMKVVADRQAHTLVDLKVAQGAAAQAAGQAATARAAADQARKDAQRATKDAEAAVAQTGELEKSALSALEVLLKQAHLEGDAFRARTLEEQQAASILALAAPKFGLGLPPIAATQDGPKPGLPKSAGVDPGDGPPGANHLRPRAQRFRDLVVELFKVVDIGGWRPSDAISGDHPSGRAVDVMIGTGGQLPNPELTKVGWSIARWAQANAADLGVTYIIWQGRIWSVEHADEGWRDYTKNFPYGSNANPTTLHMDHVHVSFR